MLHPDHGLPRHGTTAECGPLSDKEIELSLAKVLHKVYVPLDDCIPSYFGYLGLIFQFSLISRLQLTQKEKYSNNF